MVFQRLSAHELEQRTAPGGDLCTDGWNEATLGERFAICHRWLEACLTGWSYTDALSGETRALLDAPTLMWAYVAAVRHNYEGETPEEKKADSPGSTATSTGTLAPVVPMPG
jgi:hypothetical protein